MQELFIQDQSIPNAILDQYKDSLKDYLGKRDQLIRFIIAQAPTDSQRLKEMTEEQLTQHLVVAGIPADLAPHILSTSLSRIHADGNEASQS